MVGGGKKKERNEEIWNGCSKPISKSPFKVMGYCGGELKLKWAIIFMCTNATSSKKCFFKKKF